MKKLKVRRLINYNIVFFDHDGYSKNVRVCKCAIDITDDIDFVDICSNVYTSVRVNMTDNTSRVDIDIANQSVRNNSTVNILEFYHALFDVAYVCSDVKCVEMNVAGIPVARWMSIHKFDKALVETRMATFKYWVDYDNSTTDHVFVKALGNEPMIIDELENTLSYYVYDYVKKCTWHIQNSVGETVQTSSPRNVDITIMSDNNKLTTLLSRVIWNIKTQYLGYKPSKDIFPFEYRSSNTDTVLSDTLAVGRMLSKIGNNAEAVKKSIQNLTRYIFETQRKKHKKGVG